MKNRKIFLNLLSILLVIITCNTLLAHSGRTDSSGGHRDNQNKSGLGSYHYHCGGHPAHLHSNGICPYSTSTSTNTAEKTINVSSVNIGELLLELEVGDVKYLDAEVLPSNATNKSISWRSSNENIATVNSEGKLVAIGEGNVKIVAEATNGISDTVIVVVSEKEIGKNTSEDKDMVEKTSSSIEKSNPLEAMAGATLAGTLGGGGYLLYKKRKNK